MIPARALFVAFLSTLLSFAVFLLVALVGMVILARVHGTPPDLRFAYRHIAAPAAGVVGVIVLGLSLGMEIRHYRQAKALDGVARASR
ncbi:MAG: hypothetical protein DMG81_14545 [Acidobacteria bacterium]|nr:MAG: hypothetical protein DMG81_14545 [Acidobacteriota bacterium]